MQNQLIEVYKGVKHHLPLLLVSYAEQSQFYQRLNHPVCQAAVYQSVDTLVPIDRGDGVPAKGPLRHAVSDSSA